MTLRALCCFFLCLLILGCSSSRSVFVLVPDRDGHVGRLDITSKSGSVTLSKSGESAVIGGSPSAGDHAFMNPETIQDVFGAALAVEPPTAAVYHLYFLKGSSKLDSKSAADLERIVSEIKQGNSRNISINGHTDTTGDAEYNLRLSLERATSIRDIFIQAGVRPEYLLVANHGKGNPLVPTGDNVDEPRNRRVEIIIR